MEQTKETIRVCTLERDCECDNIVVGVWTESKAEEKMKEYFTKRFKDDYASYEEEGEEDELTVKSEEEYASRMTARLFTRQESEDLNDRTVYYHLNFWNVEL